MKIGGMKQVIATNRAGARLTPEQLADAGVEPGERAVIEIRPYLEADWIAETEGTVLSTEKFVEHLRCAPGPEQRVPTHEELARFLRRFNRLPAAIRLALVAAVLQLAEDLGDRDSIRRGFARRVDCTS